MVYRIYSVHYTQYAVYTVGVQLYVGLTICIDFYRGTSITAQQTPPVGQGPPHSRGFWITHNETPQSVGLLWMSDQPVAQTSTWQHTTLTTDRHAPGGIRTLNLSRRAVADRRLRPRGHWDRLVRSSQLVQRYHFPCTYIYLFTMFI